jgi:hypothetical protein
MPHLKQVAARKKHCCLKVSSSSVCVVCNKLRRGLTRREVGRSTSSQLNHITNCTLKYFYTDEHGPNMYVSYEIFNFFGLSSASSLVSQTVKGSAHKKMNQNAKKPNTGRNKQTPKPVAKPGCHNIDWQHFYWDAASTLDS